MKRPYIYLSILTLCLAGCGTTPDPIKTLEGISLNKKSIELEVGQNYQLRVWYEPEEAEDTAPAVEWESSKTKVATVDENGKVYAKSKGKTTITATCGKFTAECNVEVVPEPEPVAVESISLNETTLSLEEGQTFQLTVSYTPAESERTAEEIEWSSSNESVATVSGGMINAIAEGSTTITAKCGTKTAKCALTVTKYTNEITVSPASITFPSTGGSETVQVMSSTPWQATTDADWLTISPSEGTGTQSVTVSVNANAKGFMMTTAVSFTNTENSTTLQVTKEGKVMAFSVGSGKKVLFAQGNLLYGGSSTYSFVEPWEDGDLHSWYSDTWWSTRTIDGSVGTWRMFSYAEIGYVFEQRPNADKLRGAGIIDGQSGYILLPDEWELPDGMTFSANTFHPGDNSYTTRQWSKMADAGAIFLPYVECWHIPDALYVSARYISSTKIEGKDNALGMFLYLVTSKNQQYYPGCVPGDLYPELGTMITGAEYQSMRFVRDVE